MRIASGFPPPSATGRTSAASLVAGFGLADCPEIYGNEVERAVTWKGDGDLSRLAGQPVRLRIRLKDADLYALRFAP